MKETGNSLLLNWKLFYFPVMRNVAALFIEHFKSRSSCMLKFLRFAVLRKLLVLDSKRDLTTERSILQFLKKRLPHFVNMISEWTKNCKKCTVSIVFWWRQNFMIAGWIVILDCSSNASVLFSHRILNIEQQDLALKCNQFYFLCLCTFPSFFRQVMME